ncbi:hypothetical protein AGOR_G00233560 [Albula goreensis]|uniref:TBC1 domain family member 9 n=1 Tax=Albula goreensis TaxID=1534307 RepID=A0A8T3CHX1_9TELE|nr:hypothetical protein AGOR_G00233560 [Albula goreensis]
MHVLPEVSHEQDEPDSAFEATQYFFEDITPETSHGLDSKSKSDKDDGFVRVTFKTEKVKKMHTPDYRTYLRLWNQETKSKLENMKELPKLNQGQFIELCKTLYNMFSEDPSEQELYHATATVTSLLLEMGEVGKLFCSPSSKDEEDEEDEEARDPRESGRGGQGKEQRKGQGDPFLQGREPGPGSEDGGREPLPCQQMEDIKLEDSSPKDAGASSAMLISDDETKDDTSMSSYSVLSAGSHEMDEKLQCEDIADDTVLVRSGHRHHADGLPHSTSIDKDWAITFEQFLASVLTEQALVLYFEKPVEVAARITNAKNMRKAGPLTSASDYEISSLSG